MLEDLLTAKDKLPDSPKEGFIQLCYTKSVFIYNYEAVFTNKWPCKINFFQKAFSVNSMTMAFKRYSPYRDSFLIL